MTYSWDITPWFSDLDAVDHDERSKGLVLWQYADMPRMLDLLGSFLAECDSIENLLQQMLTQRSVYTAAGVQLDTLGKIVGQVRGSLSDNEYRIFIMGKIFANKADGKPEEFIELLTSVLPGEYCVIDEYFPAELLVFCDSTTYYEVTFRLLQQIVGAGIRLIFVSSDQTWDNVFRTSSQLGADDTTATYGTGALGSVSPPTGGYLSGSQADPV